MRVVQVFARILSITAKRIDWTHDSAALNNAAKRDATPSACCRKLARPFLPVPLPRDYERARIIDAFYEKERNCRKASAPLLPQQLATVQGKLNQPNFNWLCLSVWFGLRPKEVDNLQNGDLWRIETLPNGRQVL